MNLVKNFNVCIINKNNNCIINKNNKVDAFIHSMVYSLSPLDHSFHVCLLFFICVLLGDIIIYFSFLPFHLSMDKKLLLLKYDIEVPVIMHFTRS